MQDKQADYELTKERQAQPAEDAGESIKLSCGDGEAEVFFDELGLVTAANIGGVNMESHCFSRWQIAEWERSIQRHLRAIADEAYMEARA